MLDEPTEGIQPSIVREILEILIKLKATSGVSIILVEQNMEFIAPRACHQAWPNGRRNRAG